MKFENPNYFILATCWITLVALTIGTMITGRVTSEASLSMSLILSLAVITWFKSMLILRYYLNLRTASKGWNKAFLIYLFFIIGTISLIFLLGKTIS